ncbi:hypothetical protein [Aphanothece hegewaldii]|uniref:DUF7734 family protein n=1 Tax=Aphanothece hegewaldii TaxID=1521625 RepID=UPI001C629F4A|nr:hypothetical protein [Aphanothece hegewaldii]
MNIAKRLEAYTIKRPQEVLLVTIESEGEIDEIAIFKGFSSSLIRPTNPDPDIPLIGELAIIKNIDRLKSPYHPNQPSYIQQGLNDEEMESLLQELGL